MRDNRSTIIITILILCIVIMMLTIVASASFELGLSARAAVLYEPSTGAFIYEKSADLRLPMASTTKIMTALLVAENCNLEEVVEIPKEAVGIEGSSIYLSEGDIITVGDLLYSLLMQSANDAAAALAIKLSGDIAGFSDLMNARANELGLENTHFQNPHGLDDADHYTTARDLAIVAAAAIDNPVLKSIVSTYKHSFSISDKQRTVVNHNKLLRSYDGAIGVKTGYTKKSGRCLVSAAERDGLTLIAVTLDAPDDWRDHAKLLDLGFEHYEALALSSITETKFEIPVLDSSSASISADVDNADSIRLVREKGSEDFNVSLDLKQYAVAPIKVGDKLGEIIIKHGDKEVLRTDIVAQADAPKINTKQFNFSNIFNPREKQSCKK